MENLVYYIYHPYGNKNIIEVLEYNTYSYDIDDWCLVSETQYTNPKEAILRAKLYACENGLEYSQFESRYSAQSEADIMKNY